MTFLGHALLVLGLIICLYGQVRFLVAAWNRNLWWFFGCLFVPLLSLICPWAAAQTNFFPVLRCYDRTYTNATIVGVTPATALIDWDGGGESIPITNLPPELQSRYHYNPQEAQKYLDLQAAQKAARQQRDNREAAALNTPGPAEKIRIVKPLLFPNSLQIEAKGVLSEACIPNLPPEVLTFISDLDQAQAGAASLKQRAQQARAAANSVKGIRKAKPRYAELNANARELEHDSAAADALLRKLQDEARDRTTIMARPIGDINAHIRQWQFQAMAATNHPDGHNP